MHELVQKRVDYLKFDLNDKIERTLASESALIKVEEILEAAREKYYISLDGDINLSWSAKSMDEVKSLLALFAKNGILLKEGPSSEEIANPRWILKCEETSIYLMPNWSTETEGNTCRLVKIGETTSTYPKYKLVCDKVNGGVE